MNPLFWTLDDALALRCPVELVGAHRTPNGRPDGLLDPLATPSGREGMRSFALAHLCRLAQGDGRPAVEACRELLQRCGNEPAALQATQEGDDLLDAIVQGRNAYRLASVDNALSSVVNRAHMQATNANAMDSIPIEAHEKPALTMNHPGERPTPGLRAVGGSLIAAQDLPSTTEEKQGGGV